MNEVLNERFDELARAIVVKAAIDYLELKIKIEKFGGTDRRNRELNDLREWFKSEWYRELTDVDGDWLIEQLDAAFEKWKSKGELDKLKKVLRMREG